MNNLRASYKFMARIVTETLADYGEKLILNSINVIQGDNSISDQTCGKSIFGRAVERFAASVVNQLQNIMCRAFFTILVLLTFGNVNSRVYYVDSDGTEEQASKNLDMTFSAGDPHENEDRDALYPVRKELVYPVDGPIYDRVYDWKSSVPYQPPEISARKLVYGPAVYQGKTRKLVQVNDPHKGELILELRVIANNRD